MREYTPENITDAVLDQMSTTPDPRMKEIMESAVRHLHAFARDVKLTPAEWMMGIEFMTKVGQMCTPARQEFILLSDTVGLSALVNIMHDKTKMEEATGASLLGPFFRESTPTFEYGAQISGNTDGKELVLYGRVTNAHGEPLPNAMVTVWQTAADGAYDIQKGIEVIDCRGIFRTNADGNFLIRTVRPLGYYIPLDGPVGAMVIAQKRHGKRPAHIHFLISAPGYREPSPRSTSPAMSTWRTTLYSVPPVIWWSRCRTTTPPRRSRVCRAAISISTSRARARQTGAPAASAPTPARSPSPPTASRPGPTAPRLPRCSLPRSRRRAASSACSANRADRHPGS